MKEYDIEIVVLACKKFYSRFCDFKKYGLLNIKNKKVKVNVLLSNSEDIKKAAEDWPDGVDVEVFKFHNSSYVQNMYRFFLNIDYENLKSRWIMKLDDDSVTDISGLVDNLDHFYDCDDPYYLATSCIRFENCGGPEYYCLNNYLDVMEEYGKIVFFLQHEIECSILSRKAIKKILQNKRSLDLLKKRCEEIERGATDIALAFASAMAKVYPIDCPFLTHLPQIEQFSLISGGFKNHIHLISRDQKGENFQSDSRMSSYFFEIIVKIAEGISHEIDKKIENTSVNIFMNDEELTYKFKKNNILKLIKKHNFGPDYSKCFTYEERDTLFWFVDEDSIKIINKRGSVVKEIKRELEDLEIKKESDLTNSEFRLAKKTKKIL